MIIDQLFLSGVSFKCFTVLLSSAMKYPITNMANDLKVHIGRQITHVGKYLSTLFAFFSQKCLQYEWQFPTVHIGVSNRH